jgi:hypothetical protein
MLTRTRLAALVATAAALALVAVLGWSGRSGHAATQSILAGTPQNVGAAEVRAAVGDLYRRRPGLRRYAVRDVEYSPRTLAHVLGVCTRGGLELDRGSLETSQIFACAPLIFFFASYGRQARAPEATVVARELYGFAVTHVRGPYRAQRLLASLLRTWGLS